MIVMHENLLAFFNRIGPWEIGIILLLVLLLFGGRKLPELARGLARGMRIFRDEMKGIKTDVEASLDEKDKPSETPDSKDQPQRKV